MSEPLPKWLMMRNGLRQFLLHTEVPRLLIACCHDAAVYFFDPAELTPAMDTWLRSVIREQGYHVSTVTVAQRLRLPRWLRGMSGKRAFVLYTGTPTFVAEVIRAHAHEALWIDEAPNPAEKQELLFETEVVWLSGK
jgi:hypothetical protein